MDFIDWIKSAEALAMVKAANKQFGGSYQYGPYTVGVDVSNGVSTAVACEVVDGVIHVVDTWTDGPQPTIHDLFESFKSRIARDELPGEG